MYKSPDASLQNNGNETFKATIFTPLQSYVVENSN